MCEGELEDSEHSKREMAVLWQYKWHTRRISDFCQKKRHFWNENCDFCQKKGTLSKKRHRVKKKALKKDIYGQKIYAPLSKFYRKRFPIKIVPLLDIRCAFFTHFFYILPFFRFILEIFVYAFFRPLLFAKFFNKLKKRRGRKCPFLRS